MFEIIFLQRISGPPFQHYCFVCFVLILYCNKYKFANLSRGLNNNWGMQELSDTL